MSRLRWRTQSCIGRGSSSTVHRARLWPSGRLIAVKQLLHADVRQVRRLRQEADVLRGLRHPNIVEFLGVREDRHGVRMVMELVDGITVSQLMDELAPAPPVVLFIARSLFEAMAYAHQHGVVHRDVSPRNVLISWDGEVKLTDFGLAKLKGCPPTTAGVLRGTVPYVSPEQLQGGVADHRSDLFAAGVLLYELIAGRLPFDGDIMHCIAKIVRGAEVPSLRESCPWVSRELNDLVMKLLAGDVEKRYQTADEVLADLPIAEDGQDELIAVMSALRRPLQRRGGRLLSLALAGAMLGTLVIGLSQDASTPGQQATTYEYVGTGDIENASGNNDMGARTVEVDMKAPRPQAESNPSKAPRPSTMGTSGTEESLRTRKQTRSPRRKPKRRVYTQPRSKRRVFTQEPSKRGAMP